jgi:hypothetical protein
MHSPNIKTLSITFFGYLTPDAFAGFCLMICLTDSNKLFLVVIFSFKILLGTRLTNNILKLKISTKKSSLESVRQKPAKASGVRQPKKVDRKMIGMGAKSITIVRAVTADFVFDCRAAEMDLDYYVISATNLPRRSRAIRT